MLVASPTRSPPCPSHWTNSRCRTAQLALQNSIVTLDARGHQTAIAEKILACGGDHKLALKGNHKRVHAAVVEHFDQHCFSRGAPGRPNCDAFDDMHGRLVRRRAFASTEAAALDALSGWPGLRTVLAVEAAAKLDGGILTAADFAAYHVEETDPLHCSYRGTIMLSAPPPSSGGTTLCEILNVLEGCDMTALGFHSAQSVHLVTEAMRHAYLDRNTFLGDPAFVHNPLERLLSKDYAAEVRSRITDRATPSRDVLPGTEPHEKPETTQYSVVDKDGNAVSVTCTINGAFGAVAMYGLVQGQANAIGARQAPAVVDGAQHRDAGRPYASGYGIAGRGCGRLLMTAILSPCQATRKPGSTPLKTRFLSSRLLKNAARRPYPSRRQGQGSAPRPRQGKPLKSFD